LSLLNQKILRKKIEEEEEEEERNEYFVALR